MLLYLINCFQYIGCKLSMSFLITYNACYTSTFSRWKKIASMNNSILIREILVPKLTQPKPSIAMNSLHTSLQTRYLYRQYFGYGLMGVFSFIPLLLVGGILCGCCCKKDVKPTKRGGCESCGGCLLILWVNQISDTD